MLDFNYLALTRPCYCQIYFVTAKIDVHDLQSEFLQKSAHAISRLYMYQYHTHLPIKFNYIIKKTNIENSNKS